MLVVASHFESILLFSSFEPGVEKKPQYPLSVVKRYLRVLDERDALLDSPSGIFKNYQSASLQPPYAAESSFTAQDRLADQ